MLSRVLSSLIPVISPGESDVTPFACIRYNYIDVICIIIVMAIIS